MRLIALMLVRNESWVLGASLRAALRWCDAAVVMIHESSDGTRELADQVAREHPGRVAIEPARLDGDLWDEMEMRQALLDAGRRAGGTHWALVDADEILTANLWPLPGIRAKAEALCPRRILEVPMVPTWRSLWRYRRDDSVWSRSWISLVVPDTADLRWSVRGGGYQHHQRAPLAEVPLERVRAGKHGVGGVMHLQFADWPRLTAKHAWYKMTERVRWPDLRSVEEIDRIYSEALDERGIRLLDIPAAWWEPDILNQIHLGRVPWQVESCKAMLQRYGVEHFRGLNLWGIA
jgi:hypothetical protein